MLLGLIGAASGIAGPSGAAPPALEILTPSPGEVVGFGAPVVVTVRVTEFNLTAAGSAPAPGEGHIEASVDGVLLVRADRPSFALNVPAGSHVLSLELVAGDGSSLVPAVTATVPFATSRGPESGIPRVVITYPPEGLHRGVDTTVSFRVENFTLVPPGGRAAPREGHVHVLLDGVPYEELSSEEPVEFSDLSPGGHTVTLRLVDSEHHPIVPDAVATVQYVADDRDAEDYALPLQVTAGVLGVAVLLVFAWPARRAR